MSLESKIELLTAAIEKLNANIEFALRTPVASAPAQQVAPEVKAEVKAEVVKSSATHEEIQTLMLSKVRQDMANKTKVKDILAQYKAAKVTDLSEKDLQTVFDAVSAL
jgi:hypothetical protein